MYKFGKVLFHGEDFYQFPALGTLRFILLLGMQDSKVLNHLTADRCWGLRQVMHGAALQLLSLDGPGGQKPAPQRCGAGLSVQHADIKPWV